MKIKYLKHNNRIVGWRMVAETEEEKRQLGTIRDLHFFGLDDTAMKYDGIKTEGNFVVELGFKQAGTPAQFD